MSVSNGSGPMGRRARRPFVMGSLKSWKEGWLVALAGSFPKDEEIAERLMSTKTDSKNLARETVN